MSSARETKRIHLFAINGFSEGVSSCSRKNVLFTTGKTAISVTQLDKSCQKQLLGFIILFVYSSSDVHGLL